MLVYTIDGIYKLDIELVEKLNLNIKGFQKDINQINYLIELNILKLITH